LKLLCHDVNSVLVVVMLLLLLLMVMWTCAEIYVAFILNICWVPIHEGINSDSWKHGKHSQSAYASIPTYITL